MRRNLLTNGLDTCKPSVEMSEINTPVVNVVTNQLYFLEHPFTKCIQNIHLTQEYLEKVLEDISLRLCSTMLMLILINSNLFNVLCKYNIIYIYTFLIK